MKFPLCTQVIFLLFFGSITSIAQTKGIGHRIFDEHRNCIYTVYSEGNGKSQGTGFCISSDGLIVTNAHVLKSESIFIKHPATGLRIKADIVAVDSEKDLAVVRIPVEDVAYIKIDSDVKIEDSHIGMDIVIIGSPLGLELSVSTGILSGIRQMGGMTMYQTTAPISPGSSGSPVFDSRGRVIGVASSTFKESQQLNFAIPVNYIKEVLSAKSISGGYISDYPLNSIFSIIGQLKLRIARANMIYQDLSDTYRTVFVSSVDPQGLSMNFAHGGLIITSSGKGVIGLGFYQEDPVGYTNTTCFPIRCNALSDGRVIFDFYGYPAEGIQTEKGFFVAQDAPISSPDDMAYLCNAFRDTLPTLKASGLYKIKWQSDYKSGGYISRSSLNWVGECAIIIVGDRIGITLIFENTAGGSTYHFYEGDYTSIDGETIYTGTTSSKEGKIEIHASGGSVQGSLEEYREGGAMYSGRFYGTKIK